MHSLSFAAHLLPTLLMVLVSAYLLNSQFREPRLEYLGIAANVLGESNYLLSLIEEKLRE